MSGLPRGWVEAKLGDVVSDIRNGKNVAQDKSGNGTAVSRIETIAKEAVDFGRTGFTTDPYSANDDLLKAGDVLLSHINSPKHLGKTAVFPENAKRLLHGINLLKITVATKATTPEFFHQQCRLFRQQGVFELNGQHAVNQSSINQKKLNELSFTLPPPAEQKRIVAKLDALNAKSARARTELARIESLVSRYKQAVLSKAFSGELTREWNRLPLGDALNQAQVGLVRSKEQQFAGGGIPYVRMNHFDLEGRWHLEGITHVEASADDLRQFALQRGDVLFNTRNSFELVGKVAHWEGSQEAFLYNNNILRMRFERMIDPKFAFFQMQSGPFRAYLESVKSATTSVCAIYQKALVKAPFAVPESLSEQHEIVHRIESAFAKIDRLAKEAKRALELVGRLDEAILAKAFRGELVPQDENDEPAELLLARIRAEREMAPKAKRGRKVVRQ